MRKTFRFQRHLALAGACLLLLLALAFVVLQITLPYDDARLEPGSNGLQSDWVQVTPLDPQPDGLQVGDLVIAMEGRAITVWAENALSLGRARPRWEIGETVLYTVQRGDEMLEIPVEMRPYPLAEILARNWGTVGFALTFLTIGAFVFIRRPEFPASQALLLAGTAMFSATTWSLGLQANSFVFAWPMWLYYICTNGGYLLVFIASLHFALAFPHPFDWIGARKWPLPLIYLMPYVYHGISWFYARSQTPSILMALGLWSLRIDWPVSVYLALTLVVWLVQYNRRGSEDARTQLRWPLLAILVVGTVDLAIYFLPPLFGYPAVDANWIGLLGVLIPLSLAIAILRHKLFDIDTVLNRAVLYGLLTAAVASTYGLTVGLLSIGLKTSSNLAAALVTAVLMAPLYRPLQHQLQRAANRVIPLGAATGIALLQAQEEQAISDGHTKLARPANSIPPSVMATWFRRLAASAWGTLAILALLIWLAAIPGYLAMLPQGAHGVKFSVTASPLFLTLNAFWVLLSLGVSLLSILIGWLFYKRKDQEPLALFLAYFMIAHGVVMSGPLEALEAYVPGIAAFTTNILQALFFAPLAFALFAMFPDGRFVPAWTRRAIPLSLFVAVLSPYILSAPQINNRLNALSIAVWVVLAIALLYAQVYRYRWVSSLEQRLQTKWFVFGMFLWFLTLAAVSPVYLALEAAPSGSPIPWWVPLGTLVWVLSTAILPISLTVSILRHRLYDIDLIINHALVYGALTAVVVGLYIIIVGGLGSLLQASGNLWISLLGTGLVAVMLNPMRARLQVVVDRLLFGQRHDPTAVLDRLSQGLEAASEPGFLLKTIAGIITQTLKLPYAAFELSLSGRNFSAASGRAVYTVVEFPLYYQTEYIGWLKVAKRAPDEPLAEADEKLLRQIAGQAAAAAYAMGLAEDLQTVRVGLVNAREEERRRLRRDRHDGLGPVLASQGLKMAAVQKLLESDPDTARRLIQEIVSKNEETVGDIRRLVYGLRPPALDELGLLGAVMELAAEANRINKHGLNMTVSLRAPEQSLPPLPAAIEVAAYRIAAEAITNATRHSKANRCDLTIGIDERDGVDNLFIEIKDDGVGLHQGQKIGVGLHSMQERAEEVGGNLEIESAVDAGVAVRALLPFRPEKA